MPWAITLPSICILLSRLFDLRLLIRSGMMCHFSLPLPQTHLLLMMILL